MLTWEVALCDEIAEMMNYKVCLMWVETLTWDGDTATIKIEDEDRSVTVTKRQLVDAAVKIAQQHWNSLFNPGEAERLCGVEYTNAICETVRSHAAGQRDNCNYDIDAECADIIVQVAVFNELVYG
jgi:hypothetical protein